MQKFAHIFLFISLLALPLAPSAFAMGKSESLDTVTICNDSGLPHIFGVTFSNVDGQEFSSPALAIELKHCQSVSKPKYEKCKMDFYMGMSNYLHFIFMDIPLKEAEAITIRHYENMPPLLEIVKGGEIYGTIQGELVSEGLDCE